MLIHVGRDEVLLNDALRYAARVQAAGASVEAHVWRGMTHVFPSALAWLRAARAALDHLGAFLHLHPTGHPA